MSEAGSDQAESKTEDREALLEEEVSALEAALALSRKRLQAMRAAASAFQGRLDLDNLLSEIIAQVSELTDCDRATLFLVDEERQELWSRVAEGINGTREGAPVEGEDRLRIRLPLGQGVAGYVAKTGVALNLEDAYEDKRFNPDVDQVTGYRTRSLLCVPIPTRAASPWG
jgi:GAF domain-containing protein